MRKIELNKHEIELYDGVDEMPVTRYHKFTQMMVLAVGEGNDIAAVKSKILGIKQMLDDKQPEKAKVELLNLYQTFFLIDSMTDPRSLAFACLVKSIDGKPRDGVNEDAIKETAAMLDGWITKGERDGKDNVVDAVKKKNRNRIGVLFSRAYRPKRRDAGTHSSGD